MELEDTSSTRYDIKNKWFIYKGVIVMDKHGKFAKGLKREVKDMFVNVYHKNGENVLGLEYDTIEKAKHGKDTDRGFVGTFRLVRVY